MVFIHNFKLLVEKMLALYSNFVVIYRNLKDFMPENVNNSKVKLFIKVFRKISCAHF